ncbi:MAG TPA: flagellar basal-body rod protein FlgG [Ramlibacter sp.]|nr:flagellar basal-body rod protein FlgG [Ramlibacter sp.]
MFDALYIGATGMQAQQSNVEAIANNIANVNTPAYKKGRVNFSELVVQGALNAAQASQAAGTSPGMGAGVALSSVTRIFEPAELKKTEQPMDIAIQGDGFLELAMPDGTRAYTRGGSLKVNADGQLANQAGVALKPGITIPDNTQAVVVSAGGRVQLRVAGQSALVEAGQLEMVRFTNPQGLLAQGGNVWRATDASGEAIGGRPGEDGMGTLAQGFVEGSNVKLVEEMVNLMVAQRAYEANAKVVQASDEIMGMVNGLRR